MGKASLRKGSNFENEIGKLLSADLGLADPLRRILDQRRTKCLPDLMLGNLYIECKRYKEGIAQPSWWNQVCDACQTTSSIPILIYKFDRKPIVVRVPLSFINLALPLNVNQFCELDWETFIAFLKDHHSHEYQST